jgi:hypothetical protein
MDRGPKVRGCEMSQLPQIHRAVAAGREKRKEILFFPPPPFCALRLTQRLVCWDVFSGL